MTQFEISAALVSELRARGMKIASVESCTAGLISKIITDAPGSSDVFDLGITTYSNEMKTKMVGVPEETLAAHGAVSPETAKAMAEGIRRVYGTRITRLLIDGKDDNRDSIRNTAAETVLMNVLSLLHGDQ